LPAEGDDKLKRTNEIKVAIIIHNFFTLPET
jgi:hypothetical protein